MDISKQRKKIKEVALGFDFGFNPVCILADCSEVLHDNNKNYVCIVRKLMEEGKIQPGSTIEVNHHGHKLWGFKADRLDGIDVFFRLYGATKGDCLKVAMIRETVDGRNGWVFKMSNNLK